MVVGGVVVKSATELRILESRERLDILRAAEFRVRTSGSHYLLSFSTLAPTDDHHTAHLPSARPPTEVRHTSTMPLLHLLLLHTHLLLIAFTLLPSTLAQTNGCSYAGPFPSPSYGLTLTFTNTTLSSLPSLFALFLSTALDYDLQQSSLAPTASTVADLPCLSLIPSSSSPTTLLAQVAVLGSITADAALDPYQTSLQLILDLHAGLIQNSTNFPLDPLTHVPLTALCPDASQVPVGSEATCPGQGGGGGLTAGEKTDIVILVLVVASLVFGVVAWRWLRLREQRMVSEGRGY